MKGRRIILGRKKVYSHQETGLRYSINLFLISAEKSEETNNHVFINSNATVIHRKEKNLLC